ncbi:hypothetical protein, partial [Inquilinus sp. OTU3971]|uniref:hypothetical protein n=1 Tax=Inquilinus sp. OTU3971 TaxID=3043855 RepID=UPI00313B73B0
GGDRLGPDDADDAAHQLFSCSWQAFSACFRLRPPATASVSCADRDRHSLSQGFASAMIAPIWLRLPCGRLPRISGGEKAAERPMDRPKLGQ